MGDHQHGLSRGLTGSDEGRHLGSERLWVAVKKRLVAESRLGLLLSLVLNHQDHRR